MSEPTPTPQFRAFHSAHDKATNLHILRDTAVDRHRITYHVPPELQGWCGVSAADTLRAATVWLDGIPDMPPAGFQWCRPCLGWFAARLGLVDEMGKRLAQAAGERTGTDNG